MKSANPSSLGDSHSEANSGLAGLEGRARSYLSATPRPFLRWAGSKRRLLKEIVPHLPTSYRTYHEPFLGGGALFFCLQPTRARLSDSCAELIDTFLAVRDNSTAVLRCLARYSVDKETYYRIRDSPSPGPYMRAAQFIYLNKVGWNGLYRVNSQGKFNVPFGAPKSDVLIDPANLKSCGVALQRSAVELVAGDFSAALCHVGDGDLVFLDPPYVTRHNENGFIDYNENLFSWADQVRLAQEAARARALGASVIVTNAFHSDVLDLYPEFEAFEVARPSTLAGHRSARGRVTEAIFVGHPDH